MVIRYIVSNNGEIYSYENLNKIFTASLPLQIIYYIVLM